MVPTVELVEIGAGGGSIAGIDTLGRLKVGPKSAGSEPGPAAYNRGGDQATITDAHLTLGNITADGFAGGVIDLSPDRAPQAIATHIQGPLGMESVETAAAGIVELADETMANAARVHGVELGLDISSFDLLVSGGGGGLHGARIAEKLGIRRVIVPQNAGVGSAVGFLRSPVAFETAVTVAELLDDIDVAALADRIATSLTYVQETVGRAVPAERIDCAVKSELRYRGQGLQVTLPMPEWSAEKIADLSRRFEDRYRALVGFTLKSIPVELISISVTARERRADVAFVAPEQDSGPTKPVFRDIYDLGSQGALPHEVAGRGAMTAPLNGPAVIPEAQTTTLVRSGWSARQSAQGHIVMERTAP